MTGDQWITIKGDGTDPLLPIGVAFEAQLRNGKIWGEPGSFPLAVTKFCLSCDGGPFWHRGKPDDPVAYRMRGDCT